MVMMRRNRRNRRSFLTAAGWVAATVLALAMCIGLGAAISAVVFIGYGGK